MKKSVDTIQSFAHSASVSGKQPNDKPTETMNEIKIIAEKGIISNSIKIERNGEETSIKNSDKNWKTIFALSTYSINNVTWQLRDWDNSVIEEKAFDQSPPFTHRRKMFASM